jgi:hypothetical protein
MRDFELASCKRCGMAGASLVVVSSCEQLTRKPRQFYVLCMCSEAEYFDTAEEAAEAWNNANAVDRTADSVGRRLLNYRN